MTTASVLQAQERYFPGLLTEEQAEQYALRGMEYVSILTGGRSDTATGWKEERALLAVCTAMRCMAEADAARSEGGARLTGVSNDGYSERYAAFSDGLTGIAQSVRACLSGTGLMALL